MRKLGAVVLAAVMLFLGASYGTGRAEGNASPAACRDTYELDGFETPEAAVLYFLGGLKNLDFGQMLDAYAWETLVSRYSMETRLRLDRTVTDSAAWFPGQDPFIRRLNLEWLREGEAVVIADALKNYLLHREADRDWETVDVRDEGAAGEYMAKFDAARMEALKEMTNVRFFNPRIVAPDAYATDRKRELIAREQAAYGADEVIYLPAAADVGADKLFLAPIVARYGDRWYMVSLNSRISDRIRQDCELRISGLFWFAELPFIDLLSQKADGEPPEAADRGTVRYEGDGFASPEDAVTAYLEGLRNRDLDRMMRAFAFETLEAHYDPEAFVRYLQMLNPAEGGDLPVMNSLAARADMHYLRAGQIMSVCLSVERYLLPEWVPPQNGSANIGRISSDGELEALIRRFDGDPLEAFGSLANIRFISPDDAAAGSLPQETFRENYAARNAKYGADEVRDVIAVADVGDMQVMVAPTVVRYGDRWYIAGLDSMTRTLLNRSTYIFSMYGRGFACGGDIPPTVLP